MKSVRGRDREIVKEKKESFDRKCVTTRPKLSHEGAHSLDGNKSSQQQKQEQHACTWLAFNKVRLERSNPFVEKVQRKWKHVKNNNKIYDGRKKHLTVYGAKRNRSGEAPIRV